MLNAQVNLSLGNAYRIATALGVTIDALATPKADVRG